MQWSQQRECPQCKQMFQGHRKQQVYCCRACQIQHWNFRYFGERRAGPRLPTATSGALSELLVSADLLSRGYAVFRAVSPACSCDLAILYRDTVLAVEVRTGYVSLDQRVHFQKGRTQADLYGVYIPKDRTSRYFGITQRGDEFLKSLAAAHPQQ